MKSIIYYAILLGLFAVVLHYAKRNIEYIRRLFSKVKVEYTNDVDKHIEHIFHNSAKFESNMRAYFLHYVLCKFNYVVYEAIGREDLNYAVLKLRKISDNARFMVCTNTLCNGKVLVLFEYRINNISTLSATIEVEVELIRDESPFESVSRITKLINSDLLTKNVVKTNIQESMIKGLIN